MSSYLLLKAEISILPPTVLEECKLFVLLAAAFRSNFQSRSAWLSPRSPSLSFSLLLSVTHTHTHTHTNAHT